MCNLVWPRRLLQMPLLDSIPYFSVRPNLAVPGWSPVGLDSSCCRRRSVVWDVPEGESAVDDDESVQIGFLSAAVHARVTTVQ